MNNPKLTIEQIAIIKNKTVEHLIKTYWGKPHLEALPYDRRSTSWQQLKERLNACEEEMAKLDKQHDDLVYKLKSDFREWDMLNSEFIDKDKKTLERKRNILESVLDHAVEQNIPNELLSRIYDLRDNLNKKNTSMFDDKEQKAFRDLAKDIMDYRYSIEKDDTPWADRVDGIADDIHWISSNKFNRELTNIQADKTKFEERLKENRPKLKKVDKLWEDFYGERWRTAKRMEDLGFLDKI